MSRHGKRRHPDAELLALLFSPWPGFWKGWFCGCAKARSLFVWLRRVCRRDDVESNPSFPDVSVNEISGVGTKVQLCFNMAEGLRTPTQGESPHHPTWGFST